jgi:beta-glucosidase
MPHFEKATMPGYGQVDAVMGAYNLVNGTYCCQNSVILNNTLFALWGFDGYTTSDFGAMHSTVPSALAGMTNEEPTGNFYATPLLTAVNNGQVPLATLNDMVSRRLAKMFCRGNFKTPPPNIPIDQTGDGAIAREIAENGAVLLKNTNLTLPLNASTLTSIALIGPYATSAHSSGGGSGHVNPAYTVAPLAGLQNRVGSGVTVTLNDGSNTSTAASLAASSSVAIVMVGDAESEGSDVSISLSGNQDALISAVVAAQPHTIVVLKSSTAVLMPWVSTVPAILDVWYPSEEDGNVVAALLFGDVNPSGKLPITFPVQVSDQPAQVSSSTTINYSEGVLVGYRWYDAKNIAPLFPFVFGLSYTTFSYANLAISPASFTFTGNPNQTVSVDFDVSNTGAVFGKEAAQVYVGRPPLPGGLTDPPKWFKGFQKLPLSVGESGHAHIVLDFRSFAYWDVTTHAWLVAKGNYSIYVGSSSRDIRLVGQLTIN